MAEYLIKDTTLTEIADAVRAKTKKTDDILVSDLAEEINGISTGAELNFEVVGGVEEPVNPIENTFWVNTSTIITDWIFSYDEPANVKDGMVWIKTVINSPGNFNALVENGIMIYPSSIKQYETGAWVNKIGKIYKNNEWIGFSVIPAFTYSGDYQIVDDDDNVITDSVDNWKIRFLTSGILTFTDLKSAEDGIDVFCVGGGGGGGGGKSSYYYAGGGGGGYTTTTKDIVVKEKEEYEIVVGAGGNGGGSVTNGSAGGESSAFGVSAAGGSGGGGGRSGNTAPGGAGGSGGGGAAKIEQAGGIGGSDGSSGGTKTGAGGAGQGSTTREFAKDSATLYAGGGGGSGNYTGTGGAGGGGNGGYGASGSPVAGQTNTGGGGGGGNSNGGGYVQGAKGGSGIVIIRNARG